MTININGRNFGSVTRFDARLVARRSDIRYNTRGDLLIDLVCRKYRLTVEFGLITAGELAALRELLDEIFVTVTFPAPEGTVTREFHIAEEPAPALTTVNGVAMYGGVKLVMLEK